MPKLRMLISRGSPTDGAIIRAGAVVELPEFWASRFIADGTAVEETGKAKPADDAPAPKAKPKGKKK